MEKYWRQIKINRYDEYDQRKITTDYMAGFTYFRYDNIRPKKEVKDAIKQYREEWKKKNGL